MKKNDHQGIFRFLIAIIVIACMPFAISSYAYDAKINGIYYNLDYDAKTAEVTNSGYKTYYYSGDTSIDIPSQIVFNGISYVVTAIGEKAFWACDNIKSIKLPNTIKEIKSYAISSCTGIEEFVIPNTVEVIGDNAFAGCTGLSGIIIPISVTSIGENAFMDCSNISRVDIPNSITEISKSLFLRCSKLKEVYLPSSIISIGAYAFKESGLESITIPHLVTTIGGYAFQGCSKLTSVTVGWNPINIASNVFPNRASATLIVPQGSKAAYQSADYWKEFKEIVEFSILFDGDTFTAKTVEGVDMTFKVISATEKTCQVGDILTLAINQSTSGTVTIPSSANGYTVRSIETSAFYKCSALNSVLIPNSVTSIGTSAFRECIGLTSVTIPNSVTSIGDGVLAGCSGLTAINVSSGNTKYDSRNNSNAIIETSTNTLIQGCKNTTIPNSVTSIGNNAFWCCSDLTSITIPSSVTSIGQSAFYYCSGLSSITIPSSVTSIGQSAFERCSGLASITIPNGVTSIGEDAFIWCIGLTSVTIGNSVTSIGEGAFQYCYVLSSITIPSSVTSIGNHAFHGCSGLTSVTIPNSVMSIGKQAFCDCYNLTSVTVERTTPITIVSNVFTNRANATLNVPQGSKTAYQAADYWKEFKEIVEYSTLNDGDTFTAKTVEGIDMTFKVISAVEKTCQVGNGESQAINRSTSGAVTIPSTINGFSVTSIGFGAFSGCKGLTSITIPNDVTSLGDESFSGCSGLSSITIPNSVTSIGEGAFDGCTCLQSITIPNGVMSIGYMAFSGCYELSSVTIPNSVTSIGQAAFSWCRGLTSVAIPNSVTSIGKQAFEECSGLTSITIPNSVTSIGIGAFLKCSGLTSVTIPSSVTSIGSGAFGGCLNLTSIVVSSSNTYYDSRNNCNAIIEKSTKKLIAGCKNTTIPGSVTSIGDNAFYGCSGLTSITIPNSVTSIGAYAFSSCSGLTSITIPNSVTSMGDNAFINCSGMTSIVVSSSNAYYDSRNDCNAIIEKSTRTLILGCKNTTIPNSVTSIGGRAFYNCGLTSITIPNSVTSIGQAAFMGCRGLTSVAIPNSVTSIGQAAFMGCSGLTSITIPSSVTSIGHQVFDDCNSLTSVTVERATPITIDNFVFTNRANTTLYVPQGSKSAYQAADYWKEFKEIVEYSTTASYSLSITSSAGGSIAYAGNTISGATNSYSVDEGTSHTLTFTPNSGYRLKSVVVNGTDVTASVLNNQYTISNISQDMTVSVLYEISYSDGETFTANTAEGVEMTFKVISAAEKTCQVGNGTSAAIYNKTSGAVTIPNTVNGYTVTAIGDNAFVRCSSVTSLPIPNSVTAIGENAFFLCSSLPSISIPNGVQTIAANAFGGCSGVNSITIPNSVTYVDKDAFTWCSGLNSIVVGSGNTKYDSRNGCNAIIETATNTLIFGCKNSTIPGSVKRIGESAFYDCTGLTSVVIPSGVTSIGVDAFGGCSGLNSIVVGSGNTVYDSRNYCNAIIETTTNTLIAGCKNTTIPNSVTTIGDYAFRSCGDLKSVTLPNGLTTIEDGAFYQCRGLSSLTIPNSVSSIGNSAFYGCTALNSVTIPSSVFSMGDEAFAYCSSLTSVRVGWKTPLAISSSTFLNQENVTLYVPKGSKSAYAGANYWKNFKEIVEYDASNSYSLQITSSGNGTVTYTGITVKETTSTFNVDEGKTAVLTFSVDDGYRIKSVMVNGSDVTSSVKNNQYSITNLSQDITVNVTFEVISQTRYWLSVSSTTGGSVTYNDKITTGSSYSTSVNEGTSHVITFTPNEGYRIKSVTVNGIDVTEAVVNNQYKVNRISGNTTVSVTFEEIPAKTYSLKFTFAGGGYVSYSGSLINGVTHIYTVNEGTSHTMTFVPDDGCRLKSLVVNGIDVTANVVNNKYTISNIGQDITVNVTFEVIPPTTYSLSISVSDGGAVNYSGIIIKGATNEYSVNEKTSHTLTFIPNNSYYLKSVVVNGTDVTAGVVNNQYIISNISQNTTVSVTFEEIPVTTCSLSISSSAGGSVYYDNNTISETASNYTVGVGTTHTLSFVPNNGYRIERVTVNGIDVTSSVVNNQYTISDISQNTTVEVTFEPMPITTYSLTIVSSDGGSVLYSNTTVNGTGSFTVDEGNSATLNFTPISGYRLASVKVNGFDMTSSVTNNQYTISNIRQNTTVNVTFEVIPITTYTLTITSSSGGYVLYGEEKILETTKRFVVDEGTSKKLIFEPANNYRVKSVVVNGMDVTANVVNNQYTISNVRQNTTVSVTFEVIPPATYSMTITSSEGGFVTFLGDNISTSTLKYTIEEGTNQSLTITPNNGYYLKSVLVNGIDVTASVVNNQYTISNISQNTTVVVIFQEKTNSMTVDDVNYTVTSYKDKTVNVAYGNYQSVLTVPASFKYDGETWIVRGIESGALATATDLTAIIWNPNVAFTEKVANPNLLLYVKSSGYAPSSVNNVIVNNVATKITLTEAESGNDFYCPQAFTARSISYTHSYQMTTGIDKCQGWETIALPFDVQTIRHETKGIIVPFAAKKDGSQKAFWLYELTSSGWKAVSRIAANTPYLISMPNNDLYYDDVRLNGQVSFSATDVTVPVTNENTTTYRGRTFVPNFMRQQQSGSVFTMNVNNEWYTNGTYGVEGSLFVVNQRSVSPFEAYMTTMSSARSWFGVFDDETTGIRGVEELIDAKRVNVYSINGQKRKVVGDESMDELKRTLPAGVYIINGKKVIVR